VKTVRTSLAIAAASAGLIALAVPAQAAPPPTPTSGFTITLDANDKQGRGFCDFEVLVKGDSFQELRGGGKITGAGTATVTNVQTGTSITFNISGPGTPTNTPDGGFAVDAQGNNLFFTTEANSFEGVPQLVYTTGHVQFTVDRKGLTTSFKLTGSMTDVCEALS
jgi:hypothetical protein